MRNLLFKWNQAITLSLPIALIIEALSSLQVIHLIFQSMSYTLTKEQVLLKGILKTLPYFTGAFELQNFPDSESFLYVSWGIFMGYILLHVFLLIILIFSEIIWKNTNTLLIKYLNLLYIFHARVFFFPISYFFSNVMNFWGKADHLTDKPFYSGTFFFAGSLLGACINIILAFGKEFLLYQTNKNRCAYGMKTNNYSQIIIINKLIGLIFYSYSQDKVWFVIKGSSFIYLLFGICLLCILYIQLPFYNFQVLKVAVVMTSLIISFAFISICQASTTNAEVLGCLQYLTALLPLLMIKGIFLQFKKLFERILEGEFKFVGHAIHFALLLEEFVLFDQSFITWKSSLLPEPHKFVGVLSRQGISFVLRGDGKIIKENESALYNFIIEKLKVFHTKHPKSQLLMTFQAQYYLEKLGNFAKSLEVIRKLESRSLSLSMKTSIQSIYLALEANNTRENIESEHLSQLSNYFKCSELTSLIQLNIIKEISNHVEFWEDIQRGTLDLKKVADKVEEITTLARANKSRCESNLKQFSKNFSLPILLYATYLNIVRHSPTKSFKLLRKFQSLMFHQSMKNEFDIYAEKTAVAIVSLDKAKAGEILTVSGSIQNLFNICKKDIIGQKLSILFPNMIAQYYQRIIQGYSKTLDFKIIGKQRTYGQSIDGELFELEVDFKLYPYSNYEITLMMHMKKITKTESILITDFDGNILSCSKSLVKKFHNEAINLSLFKKAEDIIVDFQVINKAFNIICQKEVMNQTNLLNDQEGISENQTEKLKVQLGTYATFSGNHEEEEEISFQNLNSTRRFLPLRSCRKHSTIVKNYHYSDINGNLLFEAATDITKLQAQEITHRFIQGDRVNLFPNDNHSNRGKLKMKKLQVHIQIKPYVLENQFYKVISFMNLARKSISTNTNTVSFNEINQSFSDFADDFPVNEEIKPSEKKQMKETSLFDQLESKRQTMREDFVEKVAENDSKTSEVSTESLFEKENIRDSMINKIEKDDQKSSLITSDRKETRAIKIIKQISSKRKMTPLLKLLKFLINLVILLMIVLSSLDFGLSRDSIFQIEKSIKLINTASLRLQAAVNTWQWSTLVLVGGSGPKDTSEYIQNATLDLIHYNNRLQKELVDVDYEKLRKKIFEKNIKLWTSSVTMDNNYVIADSFSANDIIASKYLALVSAASTDVLTPATRGEGLINTNNTVNDYILSSQEIMGETANMLQLLITGDIQKFSIILWLEILCLVMFIVLLILMAVVIVKSYHKLFSAVVKISHQSVSERLSELKIAKKLFEQDIETRIFIQEAFDIFSENKKIKRKAKIENKANKSIHKFSQKKMNEYMIKYIGLTFLFIPILTTLFFFWFIETVKTFGSFQMVNKQVTVLGEGCYQSSMLMGSLITKVVFSLNPSMAMTINNHPPSVTILEILDQLQLLNLKLSNLLLKGTQIDPFIQDVLESNVCNYLDSKSKTSCDLLSSNTKFGLLNLNTQYYETIHYMLAFIGTNMDFTSALASFSSIFPKLFGMMRTIEVIYPFLKSHIFEGFSDVIDRSILNSLVWFFVILVIIVLFTIFIHILPFKRLESIDSGRRKIFRLIPYSIIQENKALKFYLIQNYPKEIENIRNIL